MPATASGDSPRLQSPRGGYQIYGVEAIGTDPTGYLSYDIGPPVPQVLQTVGPALEWPRRRDASRLVPGPSLCPPGGDRQPEGSISRFPIYSPLGFQDSVDVTAGVVSGHILAVDQGMIMAAIANELAEDAMQHAFSDGQVERAVRPLLAMEEFSSTPPQNTGPRGRGPASCAG